jgi:hypothetical protein
MQICDYCGRENADGEKFCRECGTSLAEESLPETMPTPHRLAADIQSRIWERFTIKQKRFYIAGLLIGLFGAFLGMLHNSEHGLIFWALPAGAAMGIGAVWVLSIAGKLQNHVQQRRDEGEPVLMLQIGFVILGLIALLLAALLVVGVISLFL